MAFYMYVSLQDDDRIVRFVTDPETGPVPRVFSLDPTGHFLYAASLETGNMIGFRIDQQSGALTRLETRARARTRGGRTRWAGCPRSPP